MCVCVLEKMLPFLFRKGSVLTCCFASFSGLDRYVKAQARAQAHTLTHTHSLCLSNSLLLTLCLSPAAVTPAKHSGYPQKKNKKHPKDSSAAGRLMSISTFRRPRSQLGGRLGLRSGQGLGVGGWEGEGGRWARGRVQKAAEAAGSGELRSL